jgi:hypothetical protein
VPDPYCWPLKPFHRPHPVRGTFNDPRMSGRSRAFHFGVDIAAKDGTRVYAVEPGRVHLEGRRSLSVVMPDGRRAFGYWHVIPAVEHHQQVARHQLLGRVEAPWAHVHFAESSGRRYRNPLRPGALTPWSDPTSPRIVHIGFFDGNRELSPLQVSGGVDVIVEAYDVPPLPVAEPWAGLPVTPALVRWRVLDKRGKVVRPWHAPVDFRHRLLPAELFGVVFARGTRQNKPGKPGRYRFFVAHRWSTRLLPNGLYRIQVEARDESANVARASLPFTIHN